MQAAAAKQKELAAKARTEERAKYEAREAELRAELELRNQAQLQAREAALAKQRELEEEKRRSATSASYVAQIRSMPSLLWAIKHLFASTHSIAFTQCDVEFSGKHVAGISTHNTLTFITHGLQTG